MLEMDDFTKGYVEAALWASVTDSGECMDTKYRVEHITESSLAGMIVECVEFQDEFCELLAQACTKPYYGSEQAGHDFWLTRNRHGAGFWDRGLGKVGDALTEAAKLCGSRSLYEGDNGFLYCAEG